jgi:hypothetical protein
MATTVEGRTPVHLWIVGVLAILFEGFGCLDYTMTRMRNADWVKSQMPNVDPATAFAWIDGMPLYAQVGWAVGVWLGLLGAILLLLRHRWAVWSLGISFVGAILSLGWQIALAPPLEGATGPMVTVMPYVIILIAAFLAWYAWTMEKKGVLR